MEPVHVAAYVETLQLRLSVPSVKQHLAAPRMPFDWLVIGQIIAVNPASSVRGHGHNLDEYLHAYADGARLTSEPKRILFRTATRRTGQLQAHRMSQADAYRMIQRRALVAGIGTKIANHSFRDTGSTAYLRNGGKLEIGQAMASHESARTTGRYDRRGDQVNLDEVERIVI